LLLLLLLLTSSSERMWHVLLYIRFVNLMIPTAIVMTGPSMTLLPIST